jgi:YHS domain-containing protein
MARDPVCGMEVNEQQAAAQGLTSQYQGQTYAFCSADCKRQFDQDPQRYARQQPAQR